MGCAAGMAHLQQARHCKARGGLPPLPPTAAPQLLAGAGASARPGPGRRTRISMRVLPLPQSRWLALIAVWQRVPAPRRAPAAVPWGLLTGVPLLPLQLLGSPQKPSSSIRTQTS